MKVVLIDIESEERSAIQQMLEDRKETVFAFSDAEKALAFIEKTSDIDVIITALNLEGMSGLELVWNARILAEQRKGLYVLAISEHDDADLLVEALDTGADDFLQKPLHAETLQARMRVAERLILLQNQLVHLATRDPMTNLLNRRAFFDQLSHLVSSKDADQISAIMFDIDRFKAVNDTHGHDVGDEVIKAVASLASLQKGILARLGGEEFVLVVEGMNLLQAGRIADQIRRDIQDTEITHKNTTLQVTSSFGVSVYRDGELLDDFLKRADLALYKSKNDGRNRVSVERPNLMGRKSNIRARAR